MTDVGNLIAYRPLADQIIRHLFGKWFASRFICRKTHPTFQNIAFHREKSFHCFRLPNKSKFWKLWTI